jgi:putative addiction module component (TIGR02574 family)
MGDFAGRAGTFSLRDETPSTVALRLIFRQVGGERHRAVSAGTAVEPGSDQQPECLTFLFDVPNGGSYVLGMSGKQLTNEAMALPLAERVALAQTLWQSIDGRGEGKLMDEVNWAVAEAKRRDAELSLGQAVGRSHEEVMRAARKALE